MTEMICPIAKECEERCIHKHPHTNDSDECSYNGNLCPACIPVQVEQFYICDKAEVCKPRKACCAYGIPRSPGYNGFCNFISNIVHAIPFSTPEAKPMEYELVKSVSIRFLLQAQNVLSCDQFWDELLQFEAYLKNAAISYTTRTKLASEIILTYISDKPRVADWLLSKGFLKVKEPTYYVGQHFSGDSGEYVLACVDGGNIKGKVCMINVRTGNRWSSGVNVENCEFIKASEIKHMLSGIKLIN